MPKYRVLKELFYPTDARILRRILDGEDVPMVERAMQHVPIGAIVSDIPTVSIKGLIENGWIEEVTE